MQGKPSQPASPKYTNVQANSPGGPLGSIYRMSKNGQMFTQDFANPNIVQNEQQAGNTMASALQGLQGFGGANGFTGPQDWLNYTNNLTNDYTKAATQNFMNQENPVLNNMMQNYASRFGGSTLNKPYIDALQQETQNTINPTLQNIAEQGALMGPQLTGQYIQQQGNLANIGAGVMGANQNQWDQLMNTLSGLSQGANQFQTNTYASNAGMYNQNMNKYSSPIGMIAPAIGGLIGSVGGPIGTAIGSGLGGMIGHAFGGSSGGGGDMGGATGSAMDLLMAAGGM